MKNWILIILLFLIFGDIIHCQSIKDSLIHELERVTEDTAKIRIMCEISMDFIVYDPVDTAAIKYAEKSLEFSEKIDYDEGIAKSCYCLGVFFQNQDKYGKSLEYLTRSRLIYEKLENKGGLAQVYNAFAKLWFTVEEYDKALKYFEESNILYRELGDPSNEATTYLNMGAALDELAQYDLALRYIFTAKRIFDSIGNKRKICASDLNIGEHYELKGELEKAEQFYLDGLKLSKEINVKPRIADSYYHLGRYYYKTGELNEAEKYLDSAYSQANELESLSRRIEVAKYLENIYKTKGNIKDALMYAEIYNAINDSLSKVEISSQLAKLEWERELELERQLQEKVLQRQKLLRNFSFIAFFLVFIILAVLYRNYRIKRKTNQLLAEIDQLKSRMFSNISHEFRTPLTLILGPLEEMLDKSSSGRPSGKTLKMMQRNAKRLLNLVNQMLDLSRMDAGKLKLELVEDDVIRAVKLIVLGFTSHADQKKIHYDYSLPEEKCIRYYDADKIEKILCNLLSNAFKFTPEQGSVTVAVGISTGNEFRPVVPLLSTRYWLDITVADTGKGIPGDQLDRIFDRFHQVESAHELETIGSGIGLALTKELVDLMHGRINVESEPGKGTKFHVVLPLGKEHLNETEYIISGKEIPVSPDRLVGIVDEEEESEEISVDVVYEGDDLPVLLVVEDNADIRTHIRENMGEFRILEAGNGKTGLDIAIERIPDLVITDLMMPEMDGVELCSKLKTDERTSHVPVIMLTAKAAVENRIEGFETGADDYITKPFNMKELKIRINNLITQRAKLRERFRKEVTLEPKDIAVTSTDEKFLNRIMECIEKNMSDNEFDVKALNADIGLSHMQLFRKLKALTDQSPSEFIRTIRLKRAARLIEQNFGNVAEVTYEVGFNNLSYFAKCFKELYGMSPSEYAKGRS